MDAGRIYRTALRFGQQRTKVIYLELIKKRVEDLIPYENNPRINDGAVDAWYSDRKQSTVLCFDRPTKAELHPTMKPVALFDYQIKNSSKGGDIVLDLFGGSGTTMVACEQNGRSAYLMELDPRYADVIVKRWEQLTGNKAVKL